jgi:hypothetical protein
MFSWMIPLVFAAGLALTLLHNSDGSHEGASDGSREGAPDGSIDGTGGPSVPARSPAAADSQAGAASTPSRLFSITRSKNDNRVCYDVRLAGAKLDPEDPVNVYWIIPSEKNKIEELSGMERRRAYGYDLKKAYGGDSADITLKPIPQTLRLKKLGGRWAAVTKIDSVDARLDSAFVMATDSGLLPKVEWVKLFGTAVGTSRAVIDTLRP